VIVATVFSAGGASVGATSVGTTSGGASVSEATGGASVATVVGVVVAHADNNTEAIIIHVNKMCLRCISLSSIVNALLILFGL
jgi:hypothetical protein